METNVVLAVLLAAIASFISNLGVNLQKLHHIRARSTAPASSASFASTSLTPSPLPLSPNPPAPSFEYHYSSSLLWRLGLLLIIFGSLFDVAALGLGPQSLVAPLGSLTLVSNVLCAYILLKERVTRYDVSATALIVVGATIAIAFGAHEQHEWEVADLFHFFTQPPFILYATIIVLFSIFCYTQLHKLELLEKDVGKSSPVYLQHRSRHRFYYPALAGTIGAQSVLFAKCSVELILSSVRARSAGLFLLHWQSYVVLSCMFASIFMQIGYLNEGLRRFSSTYSIPVFQAFWIIISVVSGLIFYREYDKMARWDMLLFSFGVIMTVVGVVMLSGRDTEDHHQHHHRGGHVQLTTDTAAGSEDDEDEDDLQLDVSGGDSDDGHSDDEAQIEMSVLAVSTALPTATSAAPATPRGGVKLMKEIISAANGHLTVNGRGRGDGAVAGTPTPEASPVEEKKEADMMPLIPSRSSSATVVLTRGSSKRLGD